MKNQLLEKQILELVMNKKLAPEDALALLSQPHESIAVVGAAFRLPHASDSHELLAILENGESVIAPFPRERFDLIAGVLTTTTQGRAKSYEEYISDPRSHGAWLRRIEYFNPELAAMSPHEAQFLSPQNRIFLEVSREALLQLGDKLSALRGSRTGIFTAYTPSHTFEYLRLHPEVDERAFVYGIPANLSYQLAYLHDFRGPVLNVNTTCSSSLAAVHLAKNALLAKECDLALACGVSLGLAPFWEESPDHLVLSKRRHCAAFGEQADGIVPGEGVIVVALCRLADALEHKRSILAVIRGSAMGSDGASNGIQVPNPDAQCKNILAAQADAAVALERLAYVECHGAGTAVGDVIEFEALSAAFRHSTGQSAFCRLGSIKSNLGHLGDGAGLAGLLKMVLALQHRVLPGIARFTAPNPRLLLAGSPFVLSGATAVWDKPAEGARLCAVGSIGISGTNVHVIMEDAPEVTPPAAASPLPIFLSASSRWGLWDLALRLKLALAQWAKLTLSEIATTLNGTRDHAEPIRLCVLAASTSDLVAKLERVETVRTFERPPETFPADGIFLCDLPSNRERCSQFLSSQSATPPSLWHATMMAFVQGKDISAELRGYPWNGRGVLLPVPRTAAQRIWPETPQTKPSEIARDIFFDRSWVQADFPLPARPLTLHGETWVVVTSAQSVKTTAELIAAMQRQGARVTSLRLGTARAKLASDVYEIDVNQPDDFLWFVAQLVSGALHGIVHAALWTAEPADRESRIALRSSQDLGAFSLFRLIKAVMAHRPGSSLRLVTVAAGAEAVLATEVPLAARTTVFGLTKVIAQEYPEVASLSLDIEFKAQPQLALDTVLSALTTHGRPGRESFALRRAQLWTQVVDRAPPSDGQPIPLREGGVYLIAGGTGYLGPQVVEHIAKKVRAQFIVLSRRGFSIDATATDAATQTFRAAVERGSRIEFHACDIADSVALAVTMRQVQERHGAITGAFMLTKELYHLWIGELTDSQFQRGILSRLQGAWNLQQELRLSRPDFLLLFSSISSLIGTKGAAECCAVNQFLDTAGTQFTRCSGIPTYVMNWTLILDQQDVFAAASAIPPITFREFQAALERFFSEGRPWALIAAFDEAEVINLRPVLRIPFTDAFWSRLTAKISPIKAAAPPAVVSARSLRELEQALKQLWAQLLGEQPFDERSGFFQVGGTSLSALKFVTGFRKQFSPVKFEVADLYAMPSFGQQLRFLAQKLGPASPDDPSPGAPDAEDAGLDAMLDALANDQLSVEAAAALLMK